MQKWFMPAAVLFLVILNCLGVSGQWTDQSSVSGVNLVSYTAKSVITGFDSYFPSSLPASLKIPFLTPDSTHPNLAFWYTPDVFIRDGVADGTRVSEWNNVANICYDGHADVTSCTYLKKLNKQPISGGNTKYVEALKQSVEANRPVYKDNVLNGFGVVRFTRAASDGTSGKYLEMYKRCTTTDCSAADVTAGFVTDWTNSLTTPTSTAFTIFMVLKTYQSPSDTNPMGILNLVTAGAKTGLGLFKTEAKCFLYAGALAAQTGGDTLLNAVAFLASPTAPATPPSAVPRTYEGSSIVIYGVAQDAQTKVSKTSSRCTVARYLLVGQLTAAISTVATTTITIRGGRGSIGGDNEAGANGFKSTAAVSAGTVNIRFGTVAGNAPGMPTDMTVTAFAAGGALGADTELTVASFTPTAVVPAGTSIFVGIGGEFHLARLSGCTATAAQSGAPFDIVPTGFRAPDCPPSTTRQMSTLSAYYGGVADDSGDSGCGSECGAAGGCDPVGGKFGAGGACANKWGSGRALQDPSAKWRVVALVVRGNELRGYVDGLHDGCAAASGPCAVVPPMAITAATAVALHNLRLGLMDTQAAAATDFATMDLAEILIYDRALTAQELDRVGNYLATKFDLPHFRLNDDARSPTRTVALSRSFGCRSALRKKETGKLCDGLAAVACNIGPTQVTLSAGADATDDYYVGRRLTVRVGGDSTASSGIRSADGQTCLITNYVGATRLAGCDFTSLGSSYVLWSGASYPPAPGYEAVTAFDATLQVAWAPAMAPPYYALIGDPNRRRAVVRVTAASTAGPGFRLTVESVLGSTVRSPVTTADAARSDLHAPNTITYARSYLAGDATAPPAHVAPGATSILAGSLGPYAATSIASASNWRAQLSAPGTAASAATAATEAVQVVSAAPVTFTVDLTLATGDAAVVLTADTPFNALPAKALLQLGDLTSGEVVTVSAACTVAALTGSGQTSMCNIARWVPAGSQRVVPAGTKATWVSYSKPSTPPLISFTLSAALDATEATLALTADTGFQVTDLGVGDVLLVGSEAIKIDAPCTPPGLCGAVLRGQSMAQWGAATAATNSAAMTTAAAASIWAKAYLVARAKGVALSDAMDRATLSFSIANSDGLAAVDRVVTLTSQSPFALGLLAAGDLLEVLPSAEMLYVTGPCIPASSAAQAAAVCTASPCTGCFCGTCPVSRAQLSSAAAAAIAGDTLRIVRRGSTYANPVALHLFSAFTLNSGVYPDGGTSGADGTMTLVGAPPAATCTDVGSGYSSLPTAVVIGQSRTSNIAQPTTCLVTFAIALSAIGSGKVTVTAGGSATNCIGGVFDLLFIGGSGTLTPGTCTLTLDAGTHTSAISSAGAGYSAAPTVSFVTGAQPRGCLATLISGFSVTGGALDAAPSLSATADGTISTVDGCLFDSASALAFSAPTVTPAAGSYVIPGLTPTVNPVFNTDVGSDYVVDTTHVTVTVDPTLLAVVSCNVDVTIAAGTDAGTLKVTVGGTSIAGNGAGCIAGTYPFVFAYNLPGSATPTPPVSPTITIATPTTAYNAVEPGGCLAMPCNGVGTSAGPLQTMTVTIGTGIANSVSIAQAGTCGISFGVTNNGASWNILVAGSSANCIIGTFPAVFTIASAGGSPPPAFNIVFTAAAAPTYSAGMGTCSSGGNVCDNVGSNYVALPTVTIGLGVAGGGFIGAQPNTCLVIFTVALGSAAGKVRVTGITGASAAVGEGCLIGTYGLTFTNVVGGAGTFTGGTIKFESGAVTVAFTSFGANYPARPRLTMGGQPNSCTATTDTGASFDPATGSFSAGPASFVGGTLAGCLIEASATLNLDIGAGATEPAVGHYTITAGGALGTVEVTAAGFGYSAFPSLVPAPTGAGGQDPACTQTALIATPTALLSTGIPIGQLIGTSVPSLLSGCTPGAFSILFAKPQTYSIAVTADTPFGAGALRYNDMLLVGREAVRVAGPCTSATPPVCPVIRGQLSTIPGVHGTGAKLVRIRRSPAPPATQPISFALAGQSLSPSTSLVLSANTWFAASSLAYGDKLLVSTVIVECRAAGCGTIARPITGDADLDVGDVAHLLPATAITFTLTSFLSAGLANGLVDSLFFVSDQPSVAVALKSGDMLLVNSELVQVRGDCAGSPCDIVRAKGGTMLADAAVGNRAVLVRRVNGHSLTAPIAFKVNNALGLAVQDSSVTLTATTNFAVASLRARDVLIVGSEFLQLSGPCSSAGVCPVRRGVTYGGSASTAAGAVLNAVVTLVRRPSSPPPAASEAIFSVSAVFGAWGLVGLGDCPGCGMPSGCAGSCLSTPSFGHTLLTLTADGPYGVPMLAEHELLMVGTELVRLAGPCHALGCPVRRAQQYSEYSTLAPGYANQRNKAVLVTQSAITFTVSNAALATAATTVTLAADTSVHVAALAANTLLLIGSEVVRIGPSGCSPASSTCSIIRSQFTPAGTATTDPGTAYPVGTKLALLDQGLQRGYSAAAGAQLDLAYVPPPTAAATGSALLGMQGGAATYSIDQCDPLAMPAAREAPIQIAIGNSYLQTPGANYGATGGNAFWVDGGGEASFSAGGGSVVEIKGWDLLPTDMDLAWDGAVTFTLSGVTAPGSAFLVLMANVDSFPVHSLAIGDHLLIGTEIVQINLAAAAGAGLTTATVVGVARGQASTMAAEYADGAQAMLLGCAPSGLSTALVTLSIVATDADARFISLTAAGTLQQNDLLLEPATGEVMRVTSLSCVTSCAVARGQPTPLGVATASTLTSTTLVFLKRPATVAQGPVTFTLATASLLFGESVVTLTAVADPITFRVKSGPGGVAAVTAADTQVVLSADTTFAVAGLAVGDLLLVGTEIIRVSAAAPASRPSLVSVTRAQLDANGAATVAAVMQVDAVALLLDSRFLPRRLLGLPRSGFPMGSLTEGDVLVVGTEMLRVMGPCGLNAAASAPAAEDTCPVQRGYLGTTSLAVVTAGPTVVAVLVQRATMDGSKVARTENYILVTAGSRPRECSNAWASVPCSPGRTSSREQRLSCRVREVLQGSCANDVARACRCRSGAMCPDCASNAVCRSSIADGAGHDWPYRAKPALRCILPPALGPDDNLNIYLHGIKTTLTHWYHPDPPLVTSVSPSTVSYRGGGVVTITGRNFGPVASWTRNNPGGAPESAQSRVELLGRAAVLTCETVYVSDAQLLCKVPPLPRQRQPVDLAARTVVMDVVVRAQGQRSARAPQARLVYGGVPAYYMCPNVGATAKSLSDCDSCCRSACIVDQFALGTDFVAGANALCATSCIDYCGGAAAAAARPRSSLRLGGMVVGGARL